MDQAILVEDRIEAGFELVEALEKSDIELRGAFWYQLPDTGQWRLFLVTPLVDQLGGRSTYERIQTIIRASSSLSTLGINLRNITVVGPDDSTVRLLSALFPVGHGLSLTEYFTRLNKKCRKQRTK